MLPECNWLRLTSAAIGHTLLVDPWGSTPVSVKSTAARDFGTVHIEKIGDHEFSMHSDPSVPSKLMII